MAYLSKAIPEAAPLQGRGRRSRDPAHARPAAPLLHAAGAPRIAAKREELAGIAAKLEGLYGKGK